MRIAESSINLTATRSFHEEQHTEESLEVWVGERTEQGNNPNNPRGPQTADTIKLSARSLAAQASVVRARHQAVVANPKAEAASVETKKILNAKLEALRMTIELLTGKKIRVANFSPHATATPEAAPAATENNQPQKVGWGMLYEYHASHHEEETTTFSAAGTITTNDGKEINFQLDLAMHREFSENTDISIRAGDGLLVDPLVINFNGNAAQLTDTSFSFDIDSDGQNEEMASLGSGSGFLALDLNEDGVINDGSELFGPESGNGFADLAKYDTDSNGWLDENDPVFTDLKLWVMGTNGENYLETLASRGIGALLLNNTDTEFRLTDSNNATLGKIQNTSIFVRENGSVGTIQEVDLAV